MSSALFPQGTGGDPDSSCHPGRVETVVRLRPLQRRNLISSSIPALCPCLAGMKGGAPEAAGAQAERGAGAAREGWAGPHRQEVQLGARSSADDTLMSARVSSRAVAHTWLRRQLLQPQPGAGSAPRAARAAENKPCPPQTPGQTGNYGKGARAGVQAPGMDPAPAVSGFQVNAGVCCPADALVSPATAGHQLGTGTASPELCLQMKR